MSRCVRSAFAMNNQNAVLFCCVTVLNSLYTSALQVEGLKLHPPIWNVTNPQATRKFNFFINF